MITCHSSILGARCDLARQRVDENVHRFRKGRPALDVMIADEMEGATLGKDRGIVID